MIGALPEPLDPTSSMGQPLAAFPDLRVESDEPIVAGDKVAQSFVFTGTHRGEIMGIAPTGKCIEGCGTTIFRVVNGCIVESWGADTPAVPGGMLHGR